MVMLIEGAHALLPALDSLPPRSLLLLAAAFGFLVLVSLVEWSGNKHMDSSVNPVPQGEDEAEGDEQTQDTTTALGSYKNKSPPTDSQKLVDHFMSKVDFNMKSEDLDKPWFHHGITRAMAQEMLKGKDQGCFLVRPSSHRGSYAMSWVKDDQSGEISNSLIHGLFPGFSLKQSPSLDERYAFYISLSHFSTSSFSLANIFIIISFQVLDFAIFSGQLSTAGQASCFRYVYCLRAHFKKV